MAAVKWEVDGRLGIITLNRPEKMNAINAEVRQGLWESFSEVRDNEDIWVAVVTGAGKAFSAGRDLVERVDVGEHLPGPTTADIYRLQSEIFKPVIAAVNGVCYAQGCGIALSTDIRIMADSARFGWPQVKRGVSSISGPTLFARMVPQNVALQYLFTGEPMSSSEALRYGLVNAVVADGESLEAAVELGQQILQNAPLAVRAMKEGTYRTRHLRADDAFLMANMILDRVDGSEDSREGLLAFKEKRQPVWKAR